MSFTKIAILLFTSCTVALARPQDFNAQNQYQQWLQLLNSEPPQFVNQQIPVDQGLHSNQLQGTYANQLQGLNLSQLETLFAVLRNANGKANNDRPKYQSPLLDLPNHAIDWTQNVVDGSVNQIGAALGQALENTERVANNVVDTVSEIGKRGFQDGSSLVKSGIGIFAVFPKIGLGLLSRNNNNNNNGYGY